MSIFSKGINPLGLGGRTGRNLANIQDVGRGLQSVFINPARKAEDAARENMAAEERARQEARQREEERKANIARSTAHINEQFTRFDDPYFDSIADAYEQFYLPQIDEQAMRAKRAISVRPAGGSRQSSAYARQLNELLADIERERVNVRNAGLDTANQQRGKVEENRSRLLSAAEAGESFDSIASRTSAALPTLAAPSSYSPIADLFGRYAAMAANARLASDAGYRSTRPLVFSRGRGAERTIS